MNERAYWLSVLERIARPVLSAGAGGHPHPQALFQQLAALWRTIEAFLCKAGVFWDPMRVDYALRQHEQWYLGDGPEFHWDYYNSFVIQPMLVNVLAALHGRYAEWDEMQPPVLVRAQCSAAIQERLISPEGTFPPIGRSLAYRFGAFQTLAQMALLHRLPASVAPGQARSALGAVVHRMIEAPGTFDEQGWMTIGFVTTALTFWQATIHADSP